jgi:diguanylate cyclase (GGDEF)-like protein
MESRLSAQQRSLTKGELRADLEAALRQIEALQEENKILKGEIEKSGIDPLTGLEESRRRIEEVDRIIYAHRPWPLRDRKEKPAVCVMVADLDKFKHINDTFGHHAGDQVLQQVGMYLRLKVRKQLDRVQRYRGDEFLVVFSAVTACDVIDRFRDLSDPARKPRLSFLATIDVRNSAGAIQREKEIMVTLSGGIADCDVTKDPATSRTEAIERADRAMYQSKKLGELVRSVEYIAPEEGSF